MVVCRDAPSGGVTHWPTRSVATARHHEVASRAQLADLRSHRAATGEKSVLAKFNGTRLRLKSDLALRRLERTQRAARSKATSTGWVDRAAARYATWRKGDQAWRSLDPTLLDLELTFGSEIDRLKPHIIHANDFRTLGVAVRAKWRAAVQGRDVKVVWDAHEYLPGLHPWGQNANWHMAQIRHEREYAPHVDGVVTVSGELADMLMRDHGLAVRPTVVMNCPLTSSDKSAMSSRDLRADCGVDADTPLMVYSGAAREARGIDVMVEALPRLTDVFCVLVVDNATSEYIESLRARAAELGVSERFRTVPYVDAGEVVDYLSEATMGVIPLRHYVNHEIALITKYFEYAHARLPIVVSDVRAMSEEVRRTGNGEVFTAEDVSSFVEAAKRVLASPERYRAPYQRTNVLSQWTWEEQARRLNALYTSLLRSG